MLLAIPQIRIRREKQPGKSLPLHHSTDILPKYDLRVSVIPRHVRLLIGEDVFHEQHGPLV